MNATADRILDAGQELIQTGVLGDELSGHRL